MFGTMLKSLAAAMALTLVASNAQAATVFATGVEDRVVGTGITDPARLVLDNALGAPDGKFLSLGLGGAATFTFGTLFGAPGAVVEITNGSRAGHFETANIFGIDALGGETLLASITNATATTILNFTGAYLKLKFVDTSPVLAGRDGFDIDSVQVTAVPLPAGGVLLLGGLGALAFLRRRKAA